MSAKNLDRSTMILVGVEKRLDEWKEFVDKNWLGFSSPRDGHIYFELFQGLYRSQRELLEHLNDLTPPTEPPGYGGDS